MIHGSARDCSNSRSVEAVPAIHWGNSSSVLETAAAFSINESSSLILASSKCM